MSTTKLAVLSLAAVFLLTSVAAAEEFHAQRFQPFIDPLAFESDEQYFAPADFGEFGNGPPPKTGWFGDYSRMYIWITRPENVLPPPQVGGFTQPMQFDPTDGDYTWGNRYDVGYMTADNHGWMVNGFHIDGPNKTDRLFIEQVNRFNDDDVPQDTDDNGGGNQNQIVILEGEYNNPDTGGRDFPYTNTINVAQMSSWEVNKIYRLERLHSGAWLEPFAGVRYTKFTDFHRNDGYLRFDSSTDPLAPSGPQPNGTDDLEQITIIRSSWINHMVGGQFGARLWKQHSRWTLASDMRVFAVQNFQSFSQSVSVDRILYDGVGNDSDIDATSRTRTNIGGHRAEIVFGTDIRVDAAYEVTRDVSLQIGMQFMHYARGVARGNNFNFNEEDLTMVGVTFGVEVNH